MEEKTGLKEEEIVTWTVSKFNFRLQIYAWQAHVNKEYSRLMSKKK
jgi:hypothetical protein